MEQAPLLFVPRDRREEKAAYYQRNIERIRARKAAHYAANAERISAGRNREKQAAYDRAKRTKHDAATLRGLDRVRNLRKRGLTPDAFDALFQTQLGCCAICHAALEAGTKTVVDHDHRSGRIRGLLCARCNLGLGLFLDDPKALRAAVAYLKARM